MPTASASIASPAVLASRLRHRPLLAGLLLVALSLWTAASPAVAATREIGADGRVRLLSPPTAGDPLTIANTYLATHTAELGLTAADLPTLQLAHRYRSDGLGTNLFFQQKLAGVPIFNAIASVHVVDQGPDSGAVLAANSTAVAGAAGRVAAAVPVVTAAQAYAIALRELGREPAPAVVLRPLDAARQGVAFTGAGATQRPVPVQLSYFLRDDGQLRLAWEIYAMTSGSEVWYLFVDAVSGAVLDRHNLVNELGNQYRVYPFNAESPISTEHPTDSHHELVAEPDDDVASPQGWVTANTTAGNNVVAVEDRDNTDFDGFSPTGTGTPGSLVFDFAHDHLRNPCEQPSALANVESDAANLRPCDAYDAADHNSNLEASIVNLFYWNNILHDVMFRYEFTEEAGNFQQTNFTAGGAGRDFDPVFAQAQDGSGTNNANFFTPPDDGVTPLLLPPAMQMYEWSPPAVVKVNLPVDFEDFDDGDNLVAAATASFGAALDTLPEPDRTGDLEIGDDGSTANGTGTVHDGCEPLVGFTPGKIAVLERGLCEFGVKVLNAENAGAKGAIITNTLGREVGNAMGPGAVGAQVTIPSVMIGESNGNRLRDAIAASGANVTLQIVPVPNRDSDLDAGVIAHEYGHGISNRLIGGPSSIACLINGQVPDPNNPGATIPIGEQMGEGWSDFFALVMTAQSTDAASTPRGVGAYVSYQPEAGPGIRRFPYSTNMTTNPLTYGDIPAEAVPHGVGTVWASMLWDMYWNLVARHGFEPNLYNSASDAGNVRALHYVNRGLILTRCRPGFVDGRNAILIAESADGDDEDACAIWSAFARRGLGVAATNPTGGEDHRQAAPDFTLPPFCAPAGNLPPTAGGNAYRTVAATPLAVPAPGVLGDDRDPENEPLRAALIDGPEHASSFALHADGSFDYTPEAGFEGTDSFTYVAQDGEVSSEEQTVTIEVVPNALFGDGFDEQEGILRWDAGLNRH